MLGHFIGWFFASIVIPYVAPIVTIKGIQALKLDLNHDARERIRITYLLREGQYAMGSVAIASSAMFEIFTADNLVSRPAGVALLTFLIILTVSNALVFVLGVAFGGPPVPGTVNAEMTPLKWLKTYRLGAASLVLAVGVIICAFLTHWLAYEAQQPAAQQKQTSHNPTGTSEAASPLTRGTP